MISEVRISSRNEYPEAVGNGFMDLERAAQRARLGLISWRIFPLSALTRADSSFSKSGELDSLSLSLSLSSHWKFAVTIVRGSRTSPDGRRECRGKEKLEAKEDSNLSFDERALLGRSDLVAKGRNRNNTHVTNERASKRVVDDDVAAEYDAGTRNAE